MPTRPKQKTSKMTWAKLANDPSISKAELPRIARAFGLTDPSKRDLKQRATASGARGGAPARKERLRAKGEESAAPKAPKKAAVKKAAPKKKTSTASKRSNRAPQDAGPEAKYIKRVKVGGTPGQRKRGTGPIVADRKVTKATSLYTGTPGQRRRKSVPKSNVQGPKVVAGGYRRRTPAQRKAASKR